MATLEGKLYGIISPLSNFPPKMLLSLDTPPKSPVISKARVGNFTFLIYLHYLQSAFLRRNRKEEGEKSYTGKPDREL